MSRETRAQGKRHTGISFITAITKGRMWLLRATDRQRAARSQPQGGPSSVLHKPFPPLLLEQSVPIQRRLDKPVPIRHP